MAQPSGLSVSTDGRRLWIADSETSSLRYVHDGVMHTSVGQGLFDFGHVDGPADKALTQHPLGVCVLPDGSVRSPTRTTTRCAGSTRRPGWSPRWRASSRNRATWC